MISLIFIDDDDDDDRCDNDTNYELVTTYYELPLLLFTSTIINTAATAIWTVSRHRCSHSEPLSPNRSKSLIFDDLSLMFIDVP